VTVFCDSVANPSKIASKLMITCQHEWIEQCLIKYRFEALPDGEHWEDAHYPIPECRNGTETVRLWSRDHAVHGVLQSEDMDHPCLHSFRTNSDRELLSNFYPEYLDLSTSSIGLNISIRNI